MSRFDRNRLSQINTEINKKVTLPRIGDVKRVYEHTGKDDQSNFEADVTILGGTEKEQGCPIEIAGSNAIDIPKKGDKVILNYRKNGKTPYISAVAYSNEDRPPLGRAGMFRRKFVGTPEAPGPGSPAGPGNLYLTGHTNHGTKKGNNPATDDKNGLNVKQSLIRISKRQESIAEPTAESDIPAKFELYDDPKNGDSHISVEINKDDYDGSDATWGMKFNIKDGTFTIVDPEGFGIEAKGDGEFTWHHKSIDFNEVSGDIGPLSL
jgi:hypothetical protein